MTVALDPEDDDDIIPTRKDTDLLHIHSEITKEVTKLGVINDYKTALDKINESRQTFKGKM